MRPREVPSFSEACFNPYPIYMFREHVLSSHYNQVLETDRLVSSGGATTFSSVSGLSGMLAAYSES